MTPTYTVDDLLRTTPLQRRALQSAISTYARVTGDPVRRVRRRNFDMVHLTEEQYSRIRAAVYEVGRGHSSYEDVFAQYAGPPVGNVPAPEVDQLAALQAQVDGLREDLIELAGYVQELRAHLNLPELE